MSSAILDWFRGYLERPGFLYDAQSPTARTVFPRAGTIWFSPRAVLEHWSKFSTMSAPKTVTALTRAARALGVTGERAPRMVEGRAESGYYLKWEAFVRWAESNEWATEAELVAGLARAEAAYKAKGASHG